MRPSWLPIARKEIGTEEISGPDDNPRITEYHHSCDDTVSDDEVAWCSSFVNWCIGEAGYRGTRSRAARSWMKWGTALPLREPAMGCVVVLWRDNPSSWKGHVGFYVGEDETHIEMLGGNQSNEVCTKRFPKDRVLGFRWLK